MIVWNVRLFLSIGCFDALKGPGSCMVHNWAIKESGLMYVPSVYFGPLGAGLPHHP